jgi:hypothetical protein
MHYGPDEEFYLLVRSPPPRRWPAVLAAGMASTAGGLSGREPYGNPVTDRGKSSQEAARRAAPLRPCPDYFDNFTK